MKMLLLIVSLFSFISCDTTLSDDVRVDDYEFHSIYVTRGFEKEISIQNNIDIISNIKYAKKIKGPIKSYYVKHLRLVNKNKYGDTLHVIIYGPDNLYFRIGNEFYQANNDILTK